MTNKLMNYIIETLYGTCITFFYYYVFMTIVKLRPFSFGFHPPTDVEQLSGVFMLILVGMALLKGVGVLSNYLNSEREAKNPVAFYPTQRH